MLKLIACICLCYMLYHFRASLFPGKFDGHNCVLIKDSATVNARLPKLLPGQDSNRFKVVIKVSGLFNGEDSVSVK